MPSYSSVPQPDDAGLLRYKFQHRERSVRAVATLLRLLALTLVVWSLAHVVQAVAVNWSAHQAVRSGLGLIGVWEGARGQYHRDLAARLTIALPLAAMLAVSGVGLARFQPWARHYGAGLAVALFVLSTFAIVLAVTASSPDPDPDGELQQVPSTFYVGLLALGLGLPVSAALYGFLRSRLLDPMFTPEYRDVLRRTPPLPRVVPRALWLLLPIALLIAAFTIGGDAISAVRSIPPSWLVPVATPAAPLGPVQSA